MTQIKLRRDTSANFTSANPVLGVGEPAYETDTKKLKIGDGTTAYTQLEYFSAGGGGSTNISATLPLKIVDGVISLEVDGQTIQVVDGKLHANLDELGNKVNNLTGEVTDLSGRVTAAEADILTKQDVFNPIGALQLKIVTSENLIGYTETADTITTSTFCTFSGNTGRTPESQAYTSVSQISNSTALDACISIPINGANNIVKIPTVESDKLSLGYYNEDGTYIPVIANIDTTSDSYPFNSQYTYQGAFREIQTVRRSSYYNINRMSDWVVRMYISPSNGASGYSNSPEYMSKLGQCTYLQFNTDPDTGFLKCFQFWSIKRNWCYWGTADERLNTNMREQLNKITHVVIGGAGYQSTVTYNKSDFGVYEADGRVHWSMPALISALDGKPNLLNLFSSTTTRSLVINTTDNLKVTNGELDVGTAVTTQGNTFNGANQLVKLDSSGKLPAIDGSQLTNLPGGGSTPTNMVTTDTTQTITGRKTFGDKIIFNRPDSEAAEQSSILGGEFKLGTSNYDNSIYANQLLLNANTTNAGTFKVQTFSTHFTQINGATITSQRTGTGAYKIINTIRPSGNSSNKNYSVLYSEVDDSYNHKLTINNLSSDLVLAGKTIKDGSGNEFLTSGNVTAGDNITITNTTNGVQIASTAVTPVRYPVEVSDKSLMPSWYVVYNDGWCEQGGLSVATASQNHVTLLKSFANTNYLVIGSISGSNETLNIPSASSTKLIDSFEFYVTNKGGDAYWKAFGYIS